SGRALTCHILRHVPRSLLFTFSFYYSVHLRDLHSFPTRRSSDLGSRRRATSGPCPAASCERGQPDSNGCRTRALKRGATACQWEDRKSTRLNSSHSQISYAVFCLKKKKKQHPPPPSI